MQPEVPNQLPPSESQPQNVASNAFQSTAPYPVNPPLQPVNPGMLNDQNKTKRSLSGLIVIVLLVLSLISALGFGIWAFVSRQAYKNNTEQISAKAVELALSEQKTTLDAQFAEQQKQPYDTFTGRPEAGSISFQYPRTWSAHVIEQDVGNPINGYLHPGFVPNTTDNKTAFALRIEVVTASYADTLKQFEGLSQQGTVKISAYTFPKVAGSLGAMLTGKVIQGKESADGTMVIMPIRDKTLKLWTESNSAFGKDYTDAVLASFSYVP